MKTLLLLLSIFAVCRCGHSQETTNVFAVATIGKDTLYLSETDETALLLHTVWHMDKIEVKPVFVFVSDEELMVIYRRRAEALKD